IRTNVKRTSALELQKVLKSEEVYTGSLDGLYGKGTAAAYEKLQQQSRQLQKYAILAKHLPVEDVNMEPASTLEKTIGAIPSNPTLALQTLERLNDPMAKVFSAYMIFAAGNNNPAKTNQLMNEAIQATFGQQKVKNQPPFDFRATYAYSSLDQLLLHLTYVQMGNPDVALPAWLLRQHPKEMQQALEPFDTMSDTNHNISGEAGFMDWTSLQLLQTIAEDLYAGPALDQANRMELKNERTKIFLLPKPLSADQKTSITTWYSQTMSTLDEWAAEDALHLEHIKAYKAAFYQSQVLLEDYFMDQGLKYTDAKPLALRTLKTVVAPYLESFF
ncbi:MAG: hypothetical protein AAFO94_14745, partial [Bacteroidota bacterium]